MQMAFQKAVDIYDVTTHSWTTAQLSEARCELAGAGLHNKIIFAGGELSPGTSKTVDIYDIQTGTWTATTINEARHNLAAAGTGNKILVGGGNGPNGRSRNVDVFMLSN